MSRRKPKPPRTPWMLIGDFFPKILMWLDRMDFLTQGSEPARLAQFHRAKLFGQTAAESHCSGNWTAESVEDLEVLITAFKFRELIPRAVDSAVAAIKNFEAQGGRGGIVVVEDCGRDGTWEWLLSQLNSAEVPFRILQPPVNIGLAAARNLALQTTRAQSIFILDADNEVCPTALAALRHSLTTNEAAFAYGPIRVIDEDGAMESQISGRPPDREFLMNHANHIDAMGLYDTRALKASGGWSLELLAYGWGLEDYELWIRWLLQDMNWAFIPEYIGTYYAKSDSMSRALNPLTETHLYAYMRHMHGPEFKVSRER